MTNNTSKILQQITEQLILIDRSLILIEKALKVEPAKNPTHEHKHFEVESKTTLDKCLVEVRNHASRVKAYADSITRGQW